MVPSNGLHFRTLNIRRPLTRGPGQQPSLFLLNPLLPQR